MPRATIYELRRSGVSQEDIELAKATQAAQRRNGAPVQSIAVLVGAAQPRQPRQQRAAHGRARGVAARAGRGEHLHGQRVVRLQFSPVQVGGRFSHGTSLTQVPRPGIHRKRRERFGNPSPPAFRCA